MEYLNTYPMRAYMYKLLLISILVPLCLCSEEDGQLYWGKIMTGHTFKDLHGLSLHDCFKECRSRPNCLSFNYFLKGKWCFLNDKSEVEVPESIQNKAEFVYRDLKDFKKNDENPCKPREAHDDGNADSPCLVKECGDPEPIGTSRILGNRKSVGSKVNYMCRRVGKWILSYTATCLGNGSWTENYTFTCDPQDWLLVFRITPGIGINPLLAWTNGVSVTTDDVNCADLTSTACTQHYRHPIINSWDQLDIKKVKYSLYKDGQEVAYIIFNGQDSMTKTDWFNPKRIQESSWTNLTTTTFNMFSIEGINSRSFYINVQYGGCPVDAGYTMVVIWQKHRCQFDFQPSYPTILYAIGSTYQNIESGDIGKADFSAIFIQ